MPPALSRGVAALAFLCACNNDADPQTGSFGGAMTEPMGTGSASMTDGETSEPGSSSGGAAESTETSGASADGSTSSESSGDESTSGTTGPDCVPGYQGCMCLEDNKCANGLECDPDTVTCVPIGSLCGDAIKWGDEECDNGVMNAPEAMCTENCTLQKCGDGGVGMGEECDDGNMEEDDGCSNMCKKPVCGNMLVEIGEECDDGNMAKSDACIECKAAFCGDTFLQAGVESCDDGNQMSDDGCTPDCKVEPGFCGGQFSTGWCPQNGTKEQFTRCEGVADGGKTCVNPIIKYGTVEGGIPADHSGNNYNAWCTQLGFAGWSGQVALGNRTCDAPQGKLFGCTSYDEAVWHWCEWQDGPWYNQQLDYHACNDGQELTSITCQ